MEGFSIEDNGEGLMFNIYIPNIQPNVEIDYSDGSSVGPEGPAEDGEVKPYNTEERKNNNSSSENSVSSQPVPIRAGSRARAGTRTSSSWRERFGS